jgi:AraC-like DNA-binding protein
VAEIPGTKRRQTREIPWAETTLAVRQAAMSSALPGHVIPPDWFAKLTDFDLWLVCGGRIELRDPQGATWVLTRGAVVLLHPGEDWELRVVGGEAYTNAFIHFDLLDTQGKVLPSSRVVLPPSLGYAQDSYYFEATMRRIMFLQDQSGLAEEESSRRLAGQLLQGLLNDYDLTQRRAERTALVGIEKYHRQRVDAALSWIYQHPEDHLSAADLARKFGYSQRHFRRLFFQAHGKTPGQTQIEARIDRAKKLLMDSVLNITEIAFSLKYENVFYFSRQFRQVTGLSPVNFRRQRKRILD